MRTAGARKGRQCRVLSADGRRRRDGAGDGAGCALGKRGPPGTKRAGRQRAGRERGAGGHMGRGRRDLAGDRAREAPSS